METWEYCPKCGSAWDAWRDGSLECWNCGFVKSSVVEAQETVSKCSDHPHYAGKAEPKVDCATCWKLYRRRIDEKISSLES